MVLYAGRKGKIPKEMLNPKITFQGIKDFFSPNFGRRGKIPKEMLNPEITFQGVKDFFSPNFGRKKRRNKK